MTEVPMSAGPVNELSTGLLVNQGVILGRIDLDGNPPPYLGKLYPPGEDDEAECLCCHQAHRNFWALGRTPDTGELVYVEATPFFRGEIDWGQ